MAYHGISPEVYKNIRNNAQLLDDIAVADLLDLDDGTLKLDPTNNRIGINNANPTKTLDIGGDAQLADLYYTADYPTIRPTLDLAFAQTKQLDSRITFTRSSTGTYVGTDGLIKTAAVDTPRFDHDPITGESLGLLIEESKTNQFSGSDFASGWNTSNVNLVTGISDPAGGTTARKVVALTTDDSAASFFLDDTTILSGVTYTQSIWAKANTSPVSGNAYYVLQIAPSTRFDSRYQNFDLSNGTLGNGDAENATIEAFPDGWYRCSVTQTSISGGTGRMVFAIANSPTDGRIPRTNTGSANNDGIYVWGPQLEVGSFPTSYIPTSGSAVTRSADYASMTGTNFSSWYNQTEGTFYAEADTINPRYNTNITGYDGNNNNYTVLGTGDSPNRFQLRFDDIYPYQVLGFGPNSTNAITSTTPTTTTTSMKIAGTVKQDYIRGYANGESILVDSTFDMISPSALYIGSLDGTTEINPGHIKRIMYYPRVLNNSQLQNITL